MKTESKIAVTACLLFIISPFFLSPLFASGQEEELNARIKGLEEVIQQTKVQIQSLKDELVQLKEGKEDKVKPEKELEKFLDDIKELNFDKEKKIYEAKLEEKDKIIKSLQQQLIKKEKGKPECFGKTKAIGELKPKEEVKTASNPQQPHSDAKNGNMGFIIKKK